MFSWCGVLCIGRQSYVFASREGNISSPFKVLTTLALKKGVGIMAKYLEAREVFEYTVLTGIYVAVE